MSVLRIIFFCILLSVCTFFIFKIKNNHENFSQGNIINKQMIPIIIIAYNNFTFVQNFINQISHLPNPIMIIDNNSTYQPLLQYYKTLKNSNKNIQIINLTMNYGHSVYYTRKDLFPQVYILSDPDLELNKKMPVNVSEILYDLSEKYKKFKVGLCLDISDSHLFLSTNNYNGAANMSIEKWEKKFWEKKLNDPNYELYDAAIDTTFTLVNWKYFKNNVYEAIRVGNQFTAKHLPWYDQYMNTHIPKDELKIMKKDNKSSNVIKLI
jgi:hypothetical protein